MAAELVNDVYSAAHHVVKMAVGEASAAAREREILKAIEIFHHLGQWLFMTHLENGVGVAHAIMGRVDDFFLADPANLRQVRR